MKIGVTFKYKDMGSRHLYSIYSIESGWETNFTEIGMGLINFQQFQNNVCLTQERP